MLFCIGSPHLSPWMDNYQGSAGFGIAFDISFLFDIIYISVFFIFMCQCVYFMLLLLYMFKNLKKKNQYIMHFLCLPIFADKIFSGPSPIFSRYRYYQHWLVQLNMKKSSWPRERNWLSSNPYKYKFVDLTWRHHHHITSSSIGSYTAENCKDEREELLFDMVDLLFCAYFDQLWLRLIWLCLTNFFICFGRLNLGRLWPKKIGHFDQLWQQIWAKVWPQFDLFASRICALFWQGLAKEERPQSLMGWPNSFVFFWPLTLTS